MFKKYNTIIRSYSLYHSQPCTQLLSTGLSANEGLDPAELPSHWPSPPAIQKSPPVPWRSDANTGTLLPRSETCTNGSQEPYLQDPTYRTRPAVPPSLWLADRDSSSCSSVNSHLSLAYLHMAVLLHRPATSGPVGPVFPGGSDLMNTSRISDLLGQEGPKTVFIGPI